MCSFDDINSKEDLLNMIDSKKFKNLFDILNSKEAGELLDIMIEAEASKPQNNDDIYDEIVSHYFMLLSLRKIDTFASFRFPDYEDCRTVLVDSKKYDLDSVFCHNDSQATNALYAIDCLIADLGETNLECVLKKIEEKINAMISEM